MDSFIIIIYDNNKKYVIFYLNLNKNTKWLKEITLFIINYKVRWTNINISDSLVVKLYG